MILRNATIQYKGYDPDDLSYGSAKRICCACNNCGRVRWVIKYQYRDLCLICSSIGKHHTAEAKRKIGLSNIGRIVSEKTKIKMSIKRKEYHQNNPDINFGINNPMYGLRGEDNPNFGSKRTDKQKQKISDNHWDSSGENNPMFGKIGKKCPNWQGGIAGVRDHVLPKGQCIKLNNKIDGFNGHHLTSGVMIYIPFYIHKMNHSLKDGTNMKEINELALNYLIDGL